MVERRNLMTAGLVASLGALAAAPEGVAAQRDDNNNDAVARAVESLRQEVARQFEAVDQRPWRAVGRVREQQRIWLRSTQKYPDFIEIGTDVWEALQDWHVRQQQPLNVTRLADGRYAMAFSFTTLLLRVDAMPDYVGPPLDNERR